MTLYGDVCLRSPRLHRCPCQGTQGPATASPLCNLIPKHVAPERLYLEARWASLAPYAAVAGLLADSDEAGQVFQFEAGHPYRFEAGHCTEVISARLRRSRRVDEMMR
jgi:hypothetical protein